MQRYVQQLTWAATAAVLVAAVFTGIARAQAEQARSEGIDDYELMRVFVDTFQEIDKNYVKEIDRRQLIEAAVRGMLSELDPYSDYISPDDLTHFTESISQEFGGVGIRVNFDRQKRAIEVMTPLPGSPAYEAGIHAGDLIVEIEDRKVKDFPGEREIDEAVKMLRGKPGEKVTVGILRGDSKEVQHITLTRELIQLDTVMGYAYNEEGQWDFFVDPEQKIAYLRLTHFTKRSASEIRQTLKALKKEGMRGLVLDLRFNPGGLLQSAVDISDLFIEEGLIVSTEGRNARPRNWAAKSYGSFTDFPMAVLINRYSASASEIVSACLQDHKRAIVVGERSWGKGSVQNVIDLEEGKSALKLTTASYHRPSGTNIHRFPNASEADEWGVKPDRDCEIKFSIEEIAQYQEDRRQRDILGRKQKYEGEFVDRHMEKALERLREQISEPAKAEAQKKAEEKPQDGVEEDDDNAVFRLPLIPVPRQNAA